MAGFTLEKLRRLITVDLSVSELCDELVKTFTATLQQQAAEKGEAWSRETLVNFWLWLTGCRAQGGERTTDAERLAQLRSKLSQLLKRCDSDAALVRYVCKSIRNYATQDRDVFARFVRAFYKKTREALKNDSRFVPESRENRLFFGLLKWGDRIHCFCNELPDETRGIARELKARGYFPVLQAPSEKAFISSRELANASFRTMDYEPFRFFCTLTVLFQLIRLTGQLGELLPQFVTLEPSSDDGSRPLDGIEGLSAPEQPQTAVLDDGQQLADAFWKALNRQEQLLLALYIIPKNNGQKVTRAEVYARIGFNNEVTMKNRELAVTERLRQYGTENEIFQDRFLSISFMQELENRIEDVKIMESGHSYMTNREIM